LPFLADPVAALKLVVKRDLDGSKWSRRGWDDLGRRLVTPALVARLSRDVGDNLRFFGSRRRFASSGLAKADGEGLWADVLAHIQCVNFLTHFNVNFWIGVEG
jgi:hypothetical protein